MRGKKRTCVFQMMCVVIIRIDVRMIYVRMMEMIVMKVLMWRS
jgi:hypothetical protein